MKAPTDFGTSKPALITRTGRALVGAFVTLLLLPTVLTCQERFGLQPALAPNSPGSPICLQRPALRGGIWTTINGAMESRDHESWRPAVRALEDSLATAALEAPSDLTTQYLYAVVLGARTEVEDGRTEVRKAIQLRDQLHRVLLLDPDHPGALHILGRLNAAVMRLGSLKRFLATKLLGGGALSSASWDEARRLLEAAAENDPCVPDHHMELARLYADTGNRTLARAELGWVFLLASDDDYGARIEKKAHSLLEKLGPEKRGEG